MATEDFLRRSSPRSRAAGKPAHIMAHMTISADLAAKCRDCGAPIGAHIVGGPGPYHPASVYPWVRIRSLCPHRIGSRVKISPAHKHAAEWPDEYTVVAIGWDYRKDGAEGIDITVATDEQINRRAAGTEGWSVADLLPAGITE